MPIRETNGYFKNLYLYPGIKKPGKVKLPLISIITPTFNVEETIERNIQNVIRQDYKHIEHIFVDNCSADNTVALISKYQKEYPHIRLLTGKDEGIYDALNKGMEKSAGDWFYFLGADDELYNDQILSELVAEGWFEREEVIYGDVLINNDAPWAKDATVYDGPFTLEKLLQKNICHQSIFYPGSVKAKIGFYSLKYPVTADWDYNVRCYANYPFKYLNRIIAVFKGGGKSSEKDVNSFYRDLPQKVIAYFRLNPDDPANLDPGSPFRILIQRYKNTSY